MEAAKSQNQTPAKATERAEPGWEVVMEKKDFKVWRRPIPDSHLYEYRGRSTLSHLVFVELCSTWFTEDHSSSLALFYSVGLLR